MSQEDNVLVEPCSAAEQGPENSLALEEAKPSKKAQRGPAPLTDEEREIRAAAKDKIANQKRWQLLVRSSGTFAVWDDFNGSVIAVYICHGRCTGAVGEVKGGTGSLLAIVENV